MENQRGREIAMPPVKSPEYMHISIDDVIEILRELDVNDYKSIWEHPVFSFLKSLNQEYGAVFSLYCFYMSKDGQWNLDQMSNQFKAEFEEASNWLRFGFHSYQYETKYGLTNKKLSVQEAVNHYSLITNAICQFASSSVIDTVPRIHFYQGTREKTRAWRDTKNGIRGLLSADDARDEVYYLNQMQREKLIKSDDYFDSDEKLYFVHTDFRLENESNPIQKLQTIMQDINYSEQRQIHCIFTHEDKLNLETIKKKMNDCCNWAFSNGYEFLFPMDTSPNC